MIRFIKPTIRRNDMGAVLQTMVDEKIGPGERQRLFASRFASLVGCKYSLMLRSYPDALILALRSLGVKAGSRVGISVLSPFSYLYAIHTLGAVAVFGDIDRETGCLSFDEASRLISSGCSFIILHEPVGMIPLDERFSTLEVPIVEDITQSLGSFYDERRAGQIGKVLICGFEQQDILSSGGGCALLTRESDIRDLWTRSLQGVRSFMEMPDLNAALGLIQCESFEVQRAKREEFFRLFAKTLMKTNHKLFGIASPDFDINGYGFTVLLDSKIEEVMKFTDKYKVETRKTFAGCAGIKKMMDYENFPNGAPCMARCLSFPLYPFISHKESDMLVRVISNLP